MESTLHVNTREQSNYPGIHPEIVVVFEFSFPFFICVHLGWDLWLKNSVKFQVLSFKLFEPLRVLVQ